MDTMKNGKTSDDESLSLVTVLKATYSMSAGNSSPKDSTAWTFVSEKGLTNQIISCKAKNLLSNGQFYRSALSVDNENKNKRSKILSPKNDGIFTVKKLALSIKVKQEMIDDTCCMSAFVPIFKTKKGFTF